MSPDVGIPAPYDPGSEVALIAGRDSPGSREAASTTTLLLLEDDAALRQMLAWELAEFGYQVVAVGTCDDARSAVVSRDFDLALFDIGLPDGDGAELALELTELKPSMRFVLCTGKPGNPTSKPLPPTVIARLTKPVSLHRLQALLRGAT
jgi:DNA-binding response OmpR family regulator